MKLLRYLSDNEKANSLAVRFRQRRFDFFRSLLAQLPEQQGGKAISILDVGGTRLFWEQMGFLEEAADITILNISLDQLELGGDATGRTSFRHVEGDACDLSQFTDQQFDIVFSNSVIEHVGSRAQQEKMLLEAARVGKRYFIQTPNYYFPMEPHFHFIGFQFLPFWLRCKLVQMFNLGWFKRAENEAEAEALVRSCNLLSKNALQSFDRAAKIYAERFCLLNKSYVLYKGWS